MLNTFKSLVLATTLAVSSVVGLATQPAQAARCTTQGHATVSLNLTVMIHTVIKCGTLL